MAFIFPANGKNSTSAVCCLAFVRRNEYVCVCRERVISSLFLRDLIWNSIKREQNERHTRVAV